MRRHRLKLVSTSKVCEMRLREPAPNPADSLLLGDGTAAVPALVAEEAVALEAGGGAGGTAAVQLPAAIAAPLSTVDLSAAAAGAVPGGAGASLSPVDRVTASLAAAVEAASAAAQGVYSAAVPYAGGPGPRDGGQT